MEKTMSLEEHLAANTAAIEANTAIQTKVLAALNSGSGKPAAKAADKPADQKEPGAKPAAKPKGPTEDDLRKCFGPYLGGATDKAEKARLNATIKPILEHFGAAKITEIAADDWAAAIAYGNVLAEAFADGGIDAAEEVTFDFMNEEEAKGGEEEEDDVL